MRQLSSGMTGFFKRVFPVLWLGFAWAAALGGVVLGHGTTRFVFLVPAALMTGIFFALYAFILAPLSDVVCLDGADVVVINRKVTERIPLSAFSGVTGSTWINPPHVTLHRDGAKAISFLPFGPKSVFAEHPLVTELRAKIAAARS